MVMWGVEPPSPHLPHIRFSWCTTEQMDSVWMRECRFRMVQNGPSKLASFKSHENPYKETATGGVWRERPVFCFDPLQ
jgi:hypothetical protein